MEIERKFLLKNDCWRSGVETSTFMRQNYLATRPAVRVRLAGDRGFLTIKGPPSAGGLARAEYEYEIPAADACEMLDHLCFGHEVAKTRHIVPYAGRRWEIDEFAGLNAGLAVAEIELSGTGEAFEFPPWLGDEVTGNPAYYNGSLAEEPWTLRSGKASGKEPGFQESRQAR